MRVSELPPAHLEARNINSLYVITDDALAEHCGVRIAFTGRIGGVSEGSYCSLNLGSHVGDDIQAVRENRARVFSVFQAEDLPILTANQVHGSELVIIRDNNISTLDEARHDAINGADGFIVEAPNVATLLCFADCVPVAIVSPTGTFALVHAGWRGVAASIAPKAVSTLAMLESCKDSFVADKSEEDAEIRDSNSAPFTSPREAAASYNVYIGPYLHSECFEVGEDVHAALVAVGGADCAPDAHHIDLGRVLIADLLRVGITCDRIADADVCTACHTDLFYSYRAEKGTCGRHGVLAFRRD